MISTHSAWNVMPEFNSIGVSKTRVQGECIHWKEKFGFIQTGFMTTQVFCHYTQIVDEGKRYKCLKEGETVTFYLKKESGGKYSAENCKTESWSPENSRKRYEKRESSTSATRVPKSEFKDDFQVVDKDSAIEVIKSALHHAIWARHARSKRKSVGTCVGWEKEAGYGWIRVDGITEDVKCYPDDIPSSVPGRCLGIGEHVELKLEPSAEDPDHFDAREVSGLGNSLLQGENFHTPEFLLEHIDAAIAVLDDFVDEALEVAALPQLNNTNDALPKLSNFNTSDEQPPAAITPTFDEDQFKKELRELYPQGAKLNDLPPPDLNDVPPPDFNDPPPPDLSCAKPDIWKLDPIEPATDERSPSSMWKLDEIEGAPEQRSPSRSVERSRPETESESIARIPTKMATDEDEYPSASRSIPRMKATPKSDYQMSDRSLSRSRSQPPAEAEHRDSSPVPIDGATRPVDKPYPERKPFRSSAVVQKSEYPDLGHTIPASDDEERHVGRVASWDKSKGCGTASITYGDKENQRVWCNRKALENDVDLETDEHIQFVLRAPKIKKDGRLSLPLAHHIRLVDRILPPIDNFYKGTVSHWDTEKNCGTIHSEGFTSEIIVDHNALPKHVSMLHVNDQVQFEYTLQFDPQQSLNPDKFLAVDIEVLSSTRDKKRARSRSATRSLSRPVKKTRAQYIEEAAREKESEISYHQNSYNSESRQTTAEYEQQTKNFDVGGKVYTGSITAWKKGYGFVYVGKDVCPESGDAFLHGSQIKDLGRQEMYEGEEIEFTLEEDATHPGRLQCRNVRIIKSLEHEVAREKDYNMSYKSERSYNQTSYNSESRQTTTEYEQETKSSDAPGKVYTGSITAWKKGYGFVYVGKDVCPQSGDAFLHGSEIKELGRQEMYEGEEIEFTLEEDENKPGRQHCRNVRIIKSLDYEQPTTSKWGSYYKSGKGDGYKGYHDNASYKSEKSYNNEGSYKSESYRDNGYKNDGYKKDGYRDSISSWKNDGWNNNRESTEKDEGWNNNRESNGKSRGGADDGYSRHSDY